MENEEPERSKGNWVRVKSKKPQVNGVSQGRKWLAKTKAIDREVREQKDEESV